MTAKEAQINLRLPADLDTWVEEQAGGKRANPSFIRQLLERERARRSEAGLQRMFDQAWDSLSVEERETIVAEREQWLGAYAGRSES